MSNFLPQGYEVPQKSSMYMKFQDGENRFRVLGQPIIGWEWWKDQADGSRTPMRIPMNAEIPETVKKDEIKHFWAMPVWNYQEKQVQILEITQKSLQKTISTLSFDPDWGDPAGYDLVVTRKGQKLDTQYQLSPKPAKPLDPGIQQLFADMQVDMTALYRGGDPFAADDKQTDAARKSKAK